MKNLVLIVFALVLFCRLASGQHETDLMQIKIGYGMSFFKVEQTTKITIGGMTIEQKDNYKNHSKIIPFSLQMGLLDRLSFGLYGRIGNYFLDTTDNDSRNDKILSFGLITEAYLINEEKFNVYLNAGAHFTFLTIYETTPLLSSEFKYVGYGPIGNLGVNFYLIPYLGFNIWGGYEGHFLTLNEWFVNGNPQNMNNIEQKRKTSGIHFGAGINITF